MAKVVVVGSLNMDLVMRTARLPQLGETLLGGAFSTAEGGKGANQAVACARMGASVALVGRVGRDDFGRRLVEALVVEGVDVGGVRFDDEHPTGVASIYVVEGDNGIIVASGANAAVSARDVREARSAFEGAHCALFQLETPLEALGEGLRVAREAGAMTLLNPAPWHALPGDFFPFVDVFIPNGIELGQFAGTADLEAGATKALEAGVGAVVVTVGSEGAWLFRPGVKEHVAAPRVEAVDSTGAGDAFVGSLAVSLAEGLSLRESISFAVCAGALACTRLGAQPGLPRREEVHALRRGGAGVEGGMRP